MADHFATQSGILMILKNKSFEKIVGKGEIVSNQHFLLFQENFLPVPKRSTCNIYFVVCIIMFSVWTSLKFCCFFNPLPNKPWFLHVYSTSLLKTL